MRQEQRRTRHLHTPQDSHNIMPPSLEEEETADLVAASTSSLATKRPSSRRRKGPSVSCSTLSITAALGMFLLIYSSLSLNPHRTDAEEFSSVQNKTVLMQMRQMHMQKVAYAVSRAYPPVPASTWCVDNKLSQEQSRRRPMGLCYVRTPRAASTTLVGINQRIARNFGKRQMGFSESCIRHDGAMPGTYYTRRDPSSFLWTSIRNPSTRALSRISNRLAAEAPELLQNETVIYNGLFDPDVQYGTVSHGRGGFQLTYTMLNLIDEYSAWKPDDPETIVDPPLIHQHVHHIISGYNFIAIVERMDESLVVLQFLLGLDTYDIVHFAAKQAGSYELRNVKGSRGKRSKCIQVNPVQLDPNGRVYDFLESTEWWARNYGDFLLYAAANQSLDRTIHAIGKAKFEAALAKFREAQKRAERKCGSKVFFPCSTNGTVQTDLASYSCYDQQYEVGCGYPCLDKIYK